MLRALLLAAGATALVGQPFEVVSSRHVATFGGRALDLAFLGDDRLLALSSDALALYALDTNGGLRMLSSAELPGPFFAVRAPAGLLRVSTADAACWAITNASREALLFAVEGEKLVLRDRAAALPWPGAPAGLRYVPGTNVLERGDERLARVADHGWAVMDDGLLKHEDFVASLRVGSALAPLWEHFAIASSPLPPGQPDALLLLAQGNDDAEIVQTLPVDGSICALTASSAGRRARVVAVVESSQAGFLVIELRAREP